MYGGGGIGFGRHVAMACLWLTFFYFIGLALPFVLEEGHVTDIIKCSVYYPDDLSPSLLSICHLQISLNTVPLPYPKSSPLPTTPSASQGPITVSCSFERWNTKTQVVMNNPGKIQLVLI